MLEYPWENINNMSYSRPIFQCLECGCVFPTGWTLLGSCWLSPKVVPVLLRMLLTRCLDVFVKDLFMLRFASFESEEKPQSSCIFYFNYKQRNFGSRNFNRSLYRRQMFLAQTVTTEWTAEKWVTKRVQSKQASNTLGNRTNRWSKIKTDATTQGAKCSLKQQGAQRQRQRRLNNDFVFNLRISRELIKVIPLK